MFFSFDGIDGTGKTTQIELLADWLRHSGHDVLVCRDPGSTPVGERIRQIEARTLRKLRALLEAEAQPAEENQVA